MDCYFVQVALLSHPELADRPIGVASGDSYLLKSSLMCRRHSEISSCNYIARSFGVTKGLWMGRAKELCPNLIILPYDYDSIRQVKASSLL